MTLEQFTEDFKPSIISSIEDTMKSHKSWIYKTNGFQIEMSYDESNNWYLLTGYRPPLVFNEHILTQPDWYNQTIRTADVYTLIDKVSAFVFQLEYRTQ